MKKLVLVMVLVLSALIVNAQRTTVKVSDLPKGVADSIQKEYSGYAIKESARNVENNITTYEVIVSKGTDQKTLHFDNTGKSLKSKGASDMNKSKTPGTDMDKSKTPSSTTPSSTPSSQPSTTPSSQPSTTPSSQPSTTPSSQPSSAPSSAPDDATNPR
jgi:hypothetical protein